MHIAKWNERTPLRPITDRTEDKFHAIGALDDGFDDFGVLPDVKITPTIVAHFASGDDVTLERVA